MEKDIGARLRKYRARFISALQLYCTSHAQLSRSPLHTDLAWPSLPHTAARCVAYLYTRRQYYLFGDLSCVLGTHVVYKSRLQKKTLGTGRNGCIGAPASHTPQLQFSHARSSSNTIVSMSILRVTTRRVNCLAHRSPSSEGPPQSSQAISWRSRFARSPRDHPE